MRVSVPTFFDVLTPTQWEEIPKRNQKVVSDFTLAYYGPPKDKLAEEL